jgi:hypothetical protein
MKLWRGTVCHLPHTGKENERARVSIVFFAGPGGGRPVVPAFAGTTARYFASPSSISSAPHSIWPRVMCISWMRAVASDGTTSW